MIQNVPWNNNVKWQCENVKKICEDQVAHKESDKHKRKNENEFLCLERISFHFFLTCLPIWKLSDLLTHKTSRDTLKSFTYHFLHLDNVNIISNYCKTAFQLNDIWLSVSRNGLVNFLLYRSTIYKLLKSVNIWWSFWTYQL